MINRMVDWFVKKIPLLSIFVVCLVMGLGIIGIILSILSSWYSFYVLAILIIMAGIFWLISIGSVIIKVGRINTTYPNFSKKIGFLNPGRTEVEKTVSYPVALWALLATVTGIFVGVFFVIFQTSAVSSLFLSGQEKILELQGRTLELLEKVIEYVKR